MRERNGDLGVGLEAAGRSVPGLEVECSSRYYDLASTRKAACTSILVSHDDHLPVQPIHPV